jgi:two-component system LytT family sensor kinase
MWLAVIGLSLAGSYFSTVLLDVPFHIKQELPFLARWIIWMPLTPLAVLFASKMKYYDNKISDFIVYHLAIYLVVCTIHIFLASLTATFINMALSQPAVYINILKKCALTGIFYNFIIYGTIVLVLNGIEYYQALQAEKMKTLLLEKSLSDSRLQFLKQQLQPHFLFNTHHSIITLMKMGNKEKAAEMLEKLSELMRIALREAGEQKVSLNKELETLQLYLDIQKVRFEDKMLLEYNIDTKVRRALVPSMILQPLVENSIKYCVEQSPDNSTISIKAASENNKLVLTITDTTLNSKTSTHIKKGTGLSNSEERLHKLYGDNSSLLLRPFTNNGHSGMEVSITIPLQYADM